MKNWCLFYGKIPWLHENLRKMKLTVIFLCISVAASFASIGYAQATKLTVMMKNAKVITILNEIENQSEFKFFFSNDVDVCIIERSLLVIMALSAKRLNWFDNQGKFF